MQNVFDAFKEIVGKTFNWGFALRFIAIYLLELIVALAVGGLMAYGAFMYALGSGFAVESLIVAGILLLAALIVVVAISSAISGIGLALGRDYLEGRQFTLSSVYEKAKPGILPLIKIQLTITILFLALFLAIASPGIAKVVSAFENYGIAGMASGVQSAMVSLIAAIGAVVLVYLVLLPFLLILSQSAFFGRLGVKKAMKRAWRLGKANFGRNWGLFILLIIVLFVVSFIFNLIQEGIIAAGGSSLAAMAIAAIINIVVQFWIGILATLFSVKVYLLCIPAGAGRVTASKAFKAARTRAGAKARAKRAKKKK